MRWPTELNIESTGTVFSGILTALLLLFTLWYAGLVIAWKKISEVVGRYRVWILLFLTGVAALTTPMTSLDTVGYLVAARNWVEYGVNPLLYPLSAAPNPWVAYLERAFWVHQTSPYGPAFLGLASLVVRLSLSNVWLALLGYKLITWAAYGWMLWVFTRLLRERRSHPGRLWLLALNPAFLVHGLQDAHNDLLSVVLMLVGLLAISQFREMRGYAWWSLALVTKLQTLILWPLGWYRDGKVRWRAVAAGLAWPALFLTIWMRLYDLSLAQWAANLSYFTQGCLYLCSPAVDLLNLVGWSPVMAGVVLYGAVAWWFLVRRPDIWRAAFWMMAVVVFVATTWFAPWYILTLIPLALLIDTPKYDAIAYVLTAYSFVIFWVINMVHLS